MLQIMTLPDFAGDGAIHSVASLIAAAGLPPEAGAEMVVFRETSGGAAGSRIGGAEVSATRGLPFTSADSLTVPFLSDVYGSAGHTGWSLADLYIYAATGDTISIAYSILK